MWSTLCKFCCFQLPSLLAQNQPYSEEQSNSQLASLPEKQEVKLHLHTHLKCRKTKKQYMEPGRSKPDFNMLLKISLKN